MTSQEKISAWYLRRGKKWRWVIWVFVALAVALASAWWFMTRAKVAGQELADHLDGQADENRAATTARDGELEQGAKDENEKRTEADRQAEKDREAAMDAHARVRGADSFHSVDDALDAISRGHGRARGSTPPPGTEEPPTG